MTPAAEAPVTESLAPAVEQVAPEAEPLPVTPFKEVWAYLLDGRENNRKDEYPISDIGYFGAEIDSTGRLTGVPNPRRLNFFKGRVHMVVACNSRSLTHFTLAEGRPEREALLADLIRLASGYAGVQIDFEYVMPRDGPAFHSFLRELKEGIGDKILSVAVPARTRTVSEDPYDYKKMTAIADKILVMAYDEHWSSSEPGPVASMEWCRRVAEWALKTIGSEKLIMGLPFYGRSWGNLTTNRALIRSTLENLKDEKGVDESQIEREDGVPLFRYEAQVKVIVYYDDEVSLSRRLEMYRGQGVMRVGFWRLGQEAPEAWNLLRLE